MYQKVSVLIIEDEKSICDFISKTLSSNEYKVTTAANGPIAFATSFEPWANAMAQAVININILNTRSTPPKVPWRALRIKFLLRK